MLGLDLAAIRNHRPLALIPNALPLIPNPQSLAPPYSATIRRMNFGRGWPPILVPLRSKSR
jgi:hypothetical protein